MNTLLLHPTDTLFFRDGRPMSGSLSGHGAAWPLPSVLNAALHAALHRAELEGVHIHRPGRSSQRDADAERTRKFGSLVTAGPFPVDPDDRWFFPRPLDAGLELSTAVALKPILFNGASSLPCPLTQTIGNTLAPTKEKPAAWWSQSAWQNYLLERSDPVSPSDFIYDHDFADIEHSIGIGISSETGTQDGEQFYSAHSLRLREGWSLGSLAEALDKVEGNLAGKRDLIAKLFPNSGKRTPMIVGGQQRICTVERQSAQPLPLPAGQTITGNCVKWVLLTPAIFPQIEANPANGINAHHGGWLPNWIDLQTGQVMLKSGDTTRHENEGRESWRKRVGGLPVIPARLVAALTGKPIPVTGYALPNSADPERTQGGAKSTHLAVPAGAVYYFEADSAEAAQALANALNWHGTGEPATIRNRRSTLMGEKGFGIGVCGNWQPIAGLRQPSPIISTRSRLEPNPALAGRILHDPTESASEDEWPEDAR